MTVTSGLQTSVGVPMFIATAPYLTVLHGALTALDLAEGIVKITGHPGAGKSAVCNELFHQLEARGIEVVYFLNPPPSVDALQSGIIKQLQLDPSRNFTLTLTRYLESHADRYRHLVLIVDEAQRLDDLTLTAIRMLCNIQNQRSALVRVVLSGSTALDNLLLRSTNRSLAQHIGHSFVLPPMTEEQLRDFHAAYWLTRNTEVAPIQSRRLRQLLNQSGGLPGKALSLISAEPVQPPEFSQPAGTAVPPAAVPLAPRELAEPSTATNPVPTTTPALAAHPAAITPQAPASTRPMAGSAPKRKFRPRLILAVAVLALTSYFLLQSADFGARPAAPAPAAVVKAVAEAASPAPALPPAIAPGDTVAVVAELPQVPPVEATARPAPPAAGADELPLPPASPGAAAGLPGTEELETMISTWIADWQAQQVTAYFSHYAPEFVPAYNNSLAEWQRQRSRNIANADDIQLSYSEFNLLQAKPGQATLRFWLAYRSATYSDNTYKELVVVQDTAGRWLIQSERNLQVDVVF